MLHIPGSGDILAESLKGCTSSPTKPIEMSEILGASWNTVPWGHCLLVQHFFRQVVERPKNRRCPNRVIFDTPIVKVLAEPDEHPFCQR